MPPKSAATAERVFTLGAGDTDLIIAIIKNLHERPSCNWDAVAADIESVSGAACKDRFGKLLKRQGWLPVNGYGEGGGTATPAKKRTPAKNTAAVAVAVEDAGDNGEHVDEPATPTTQKGKKRKTPTKQSALKKQKKSISVVDENDDLEDLKQEPQAEEEDAGVV